ncbi:MAG: NADH-quinone oxidoreductase subunit C [Bacteroidota bacterium]
MDTYTITEVLKERFGEEVLQMSDHSDLFTVTVSSGIVHEVIDVLKNRLGFNFLTDITGIHYPEEALQLGVIYHLHNLMQNMRIRIKTFVSVTDPNVATMTDIFSSANWMERETYDFYGIVFSGHPDLKRILNVEYMDYFPLRKEYPLEDQTREDKDDRYFGR